MKRPRTQSTRDPPLMQILYTWRIHSQDKRKTGRSRMKSWQRPSMFRSMVSVAASDLKIIEHFSQQFAASEYRSIYAAYPTHESLRLWLTLYIVQTHVYRKQVEVL